MLTNPQPLWKSETHLAKCNLHIFRGAQSIRKFNLYPSNVSKSLGWAGVRSSFCRVCFPRGANPKMWFKRDFKHKTLQSLKIELHLPPQILILLQIFGHQKMLFNYKQGGGFITCFQFSPPLGDMIQFDSIWLICFNWDPNSHLRPSPWAWLECDVALSGVRSSPWWGSPSVDSKENTLEDGSGWFTYKSTHE